MNMDFKSAKELLDLCEENQLPISEVMRQRECILGEVPRDAVDHRMAKAWEIMRASGSLAARPKSWKHIIIRRKTSAAMCCRRP